MRRSILPALLMVLASTAPAPAAMTRPDPAAVLRRVAEVRRALATGSLTRAVAATARLGGVDSPVTAVAPPVPLALPRSIAAPVGRLAGAVRAARTLARGAVHTRIDRDRAVARALSGGRHRSLPASWSRAIDMAEMQRAALTLTRALDRAIPELLRAAPALPSGTSVAGCDLLDQPLTLCVGGLGNNTITSDYALVVDLGGDDTHNNSAGGADALGNTMPVAVTLDLGGNDHYNATVKEHSGSLAVLGSAFLGVGMLVDVTGNDTYLAQSSEAQYYGGGSSILGVGVLSDAAGNDTYTVSSTRPVGAGVSGLGTAFAGLSTFHDRDGDDAYLVESRPTLGFDLGGRLAPGIAVAQGMGLHTAAGGHVGEATVGVASAAAVFADDAGTDRMDINAVSATVPPDDWRPAVLGRATAAGGGAGSQPYVSMALTGPGSTTWSLLAESESQAASAGVVGLGYGESGGYGVLSDLGGKDTYLARAHARSTRSLTVNEACECTGTNAVSGPAFSVAQGVGTGDTGVLEDPLGNDRYVAEADSVATMDVHDERTQAAEDAPAGAGALTMTTEVLAQGVGTDFGTGLLRDSSGDDTYEARSRTGATARATSAVEGRTTQAFSSTQPTRTLAQGAGSITGEGELRDTGGRDAYEARADTGVVADPPTGLQTGTRQTLSLAAVEETSAALFTDVDGGLADTFVAEPPRPACTGTRGQDVWQDCGDAAGFGSNH